MTTKKIKVLIVDDSAVVRQVMQEILSKHPSIEVIGQAMDPIFAMQKMNVNWPDVVLLDVEMPRMDGITFLKKIMAERPTPVIICSSLTQKGTETCMEAMSAGAYAVFAKPTMGVKDFLLHSSRDLLETIQSTASARMNRIVPLASAGHAKKLSVDAVLPPPSRAMAVTTDRFTAIGTSTGGTQALEFVLSQLPRTAPGLVIVQHMPEKFTAAFAQRLNQICEIEVKEAASGDRILPGRALIAPGGRHLTVKRSGAQYLVDVISAPPVTAPAWTCCSARWPKPPAAMRSGSS